MRRLLTIVTSLLLSIPPLGATEFQVGTSLLSQVRQNEQDQTEIPLSGLFGLGLATPRYQLHSDLRLFRDLDRSLDDFDLYQTVINFKPFEKMQVDFGRQFLSEGFSAEVLDGIRTTFTPGSWRFSLYNGIPRHPERGDFNRNDGLLTGLSIGLKKWTRTDLQLHTSWHKNNIRTNDLRQNDEIRLGTNLSHRGGGKLKPFFYGLAEYNSSAKLFETGTVGVEATPTGWLGLNLEGDYFNSSRESDRPSILSLFTRGRLLSGRLSSTWRLTNSLDLIQAYNYQRIEIEPGDRRNGHLIDTALRLSWDAARLSLEPGYSFATNFGGDLHAAHLYLHEQFSDPWYADLGTDFARYEKITHKNDTAWSTVVWTGYKFFKVWTVSAGFEYHQNTVFNKDVRGSLRLDYVFKHST